MTLIHMLKAVLKPALPLPLRGMLRDRLRLLLGPPPVGAARFRRWRSVRPLRRDFGWHSGGTCIDRYYIERFLAANARDVQGRVLEIGDNAYTMRYGAGRVARSEVLHARPGNARATLVGDLATGRNLPDGAFDCIILTQTLLCIYDIRAAVRTLHRILAPGGVVLATVPGIAQIARYDMEQWGDFWRFTSLSARRLFEEAFPQGHVEVRSPGNVLAAVAFLHGVVAEELSPHELHHDDPDYEVSICIRALKPVRAITHWYPAATDELVTAGHP